MRANLPELTRLIERVRKIADGAALMTETAVKAQVVSAVSNLLGNTPLEKAMHDNLQRLGAAAVRRGGPRRSPAKIQATLTRGGHRDRVPPRRHAGATDVPLCDEIVPLDAKSAPMMGSTDVGDVSWVVPTVQARGATYAIGTPGHSWQLTAQGKMPAAHKGLVHVAKVMAGTALDVIAGRGAAGARQGRSSGAHGAHALCLPAAGRTGSADQDVRVDRWVAPPHRCFAAGSRFAQMS